MTKRVLLEMDSRKWLSLGSLAKHERYFVHVEDDGTIVLEPAIVMPARMAKEIDDFLAQPETGKIHERRS